MTLSPIALFVYNRPLHTIKTVEALKRNSLAIDSELHIFSDGPKCSESINSVNQVRSYIRGIAGFKSVVILERDKNIGLASSIISGVTDLCKKYGKVIVLEDDLETSPQFLTFMNSALEFYNDETKVMHISGYRYPVNSFENSDTFFLRLPLCWGWATWQRAWVKFSNDINIISKFDPKDIHAFDFDGTYTYWKQLQLNQSGSLNTWFIFWYATVYLEWGLSLFPAKSLVRNIGMDDSGVHCGSTKRYDVNLCCHPLSVQNNKIIESKQAYANHSLYFRRIKDGIIIRIIKRLKKLARGKLNEI